MMLMSKGSHGTTWGDVPFCFWLKTVNKFVGERKLLKVGIAGYGYWGPNLVRNFIQAEDTEVSMIADSDPTRQKLAAKNHPGCDVTRDFRELLKGDVTDIVAIATPLSTHFSLAKAALEAGRHVLVEKPLAASPDEALELIEIAQKHNRVLMVDHTFVYSEPVKRTRDLVHSGDIGDVFYFDSVRVNLGLFQHDTNVIYDLAVHDLSIMDFVLGQIPTTVSATGAKHFSDQSENVAFLSFMFEDSNLISHIHVNWLAPVKMRRTLIGGSKKMVVYDDLETTEKIKIYDKGVEFADKPDDIKKLMLSYRVGDLWVPNIEHKEPLQNMVQHFLHCIENNEKPITGGGAGLRIVRYLDAANRSLKQNGTPITIEKD
jgi:predicted dehydrogenase